MTEGMMTMKMIKRFPLTGLLVCCVITTSGCSSMMSHSGGSQGYYPGTRASAKMLTDDDTGWVLKPLALIDLPFSAVLDTLLLPWDYFHAGEDKRGTSPRERVLQSEKEANTQASLATAAAMPASH